MLHYFILAIPVLMLLDYFLTVLGARLSLKVYREHFRIPDYELNPIFRKDIAAGKWISGRFIFMVALVAGICAYWYLIWQPEDDWLHRPVLGGVLAVYGIVIARHFSNILLFRSINKKPGQLSGQVNMSREYILNLSRFQLLVAIIPLATMAVIVRSSVLYGAACGAGWLYVIHAIWLWRDRRRARK